MSTGRIRLNTEIYRYSRGDSILGITLRRHLSSRLPYCLIKDHVVTQSNLLHGTRHDLKLSEEVIQQDSLP